MKLVNLIPLKEIDFRNQDAFDAYIKQHDLRPDTKVTIAGKTTTAGQAAKNSKPVKGTSVFGKDKGMGYGSKPGPNAKLQTKQDWDDLEKIYKGDVTDTDGNVVKNPFKNQPNTTIKLNKKAWNTLGMERYGTERDKTLDVSNDIQKYLNGKLGVNGTADIEYGTGAVAYYLEDGENSIYIGRDFGDFGKKGNFLVSFEGPSADDYKVPLKSFSTPEEALKYAENIGKKHMKGLEKKQSINEGIRLKSLLRKKK